MDRKSFLKKAKKKAGPVIRELENLYPDAECTLSYDTPLKLLIATRLSAQCTDVRVNMVTPALFERYPDCEAFANADVEELENYIKSTGFYHAKARNIIDCCRELIERHGGEVRKSNRTCARLFRPKRAGNSVTGWSTTEGRSAGPGIRFAKSAR